MAAWHFLWQTQDPISFTQQMTLTCKWPLHVSGEWGEKTAQRHLKANTSQRPICKETGKWNMNNFTTDDFWLLSISKKRGDCRATG